MSKMSKCNNIQQHGLEIGKIDVRDGAVLACNIEGRGYGQHVGGNFPLGFVDDVPVAWDVFRAELCLVALICCKFAYLRMKLELIEALP